MGSDVLITYGTHMAVCIAAFVIAMWFVNYMGGFFKTVWAVSAAITFIVGLIVIINQSNQAEEMEREFDAFKMTLICVDLSLVGPAIFWWMVYTLLMLLKPIQVSDEMLKLFEKAELDSDVDDPSSTDEEVN